MHVDYLVVGQGIAGTLLSHELIRGGASVLVLDDTGILKSSLVAGGMLNPFSARDWSITRSQASYLPVAVDTYKAIGALLGQELISKTAMLVFHENEDRRAQFAAANERYPGQALTEPDQHWQHWFHIPHHTGKLQPLYRIDAAGLLQGWRRYLAQQGCWREEHFEHGLLQVTTDQVKYKDITASQLIFCEGSTGRKNPLFPAMPFTLNRGEALLIDIPGLPADHVYYHGIRLIPRSDGLFWCGSNYQWDFTNLEPDLQWREEVCNKLAGWLKLPFHIREHLVAERPTTAGQQVLFRRHPELQHVFLFNGLGTRGFSSGPYYVQQYAAQLGQS